MQDEDVIAAHRPYGLDCKCGRPINSDGDWARHLLSELGMTASDRPPALSPKPPTSPSNE